MGATGSINGVLEDFTAPILPNIGGEPTREALINLHRLIIGNMASMALNLGGGWHGHLTLTTTADEFMEQTSYAFVPPHNPGNFPLTVGTAQEKALGTERF